MLTLDVVNEYLRYDEEGGFFTWIKSPCKAVNSGDRAGTTDSRGFIEIGLKGRIYKAHRLAIFLNTGKMPEGRIRHRNFIRCDNRLDNLRFIGSDLDQRTLKEELDYNPDSGLFFYRETEALAGSLSEGYVRVSVDGRYYGAHRLAWMYVTGEWPDRQIDHINADKSDNRISNLRLATSSQNRRNVGKSTSNTSGWKGVSWHGRINKWQARIGVGKKRIHLGYFDDVREAAEAYMFKALELHGEYARFV